MANNHSNFAIIRVTPTIIAGTTHINDVMFDATAIPNAVRGGGGCSLLRGVTITDQDDEEHDMDLVFMEVQTNLGTAGAATDISDTNMLAAKITGVLQLDWSTLAVNFANVSSIMSTMEASKTSAGVQLPQILQATAGSESVYFSAIAREEAAYAATDDLEFAFHIQYL